MTRFEQFIKERRYLGNVSERTIECTSRHLGGCRTRIQPILS